MQETWSWEFQKIRDPFYRKLCRRPLEATGCESWSGKQVCARSYSHIGPRLHSGRVLFQAPSRPVAHSAGLFGETLNPKPLNPKPLNPKPLNPKPYNSQGVGTSSDPHLSPRRSGGSRQDQPCRGHCDANRPCLVGPAVPVFRHRRIM